MAQSELLLAVKAGAYGAAESLIKGGADPNQQDEQGWTPLCFAAGRGDLAIAKLLVENGADVYKVGRDRRSPYAIALAAGRLSMMNYLKEIEEISPGRGLRYPERPYSKAYCLSDLRKFDGWTESRINWKRLRQNDDRDSELSFADDKIVFLHDDFVVTESIWRNENVIFNSADSDWKEFCTRALKFKVPDDSDLIVPREPTNL